MIFYKYVMESCDFSINVILLEDIVVVLGVIIVVICMGFIFIIGNLLYDSLGLLGVGILLGVVLVFFIYINIEVFLGWFI